MKTLILNSSNVVPGSFNSKYKLNVSGAILETGDKMAIHSIMIPYSWFNISNNYNNNFFYYIMNGVTYKIDLGNQFLTTEDINSILQYNLYSNGHYLVDSNLVNWYPIEIMTNINKYSIQINCYRIPSTLQSQWTNPGNVFYNTITSAQALPQVQIPETDITKIFGLTAGIYPPLNTVIAPYSKISDFTPNLSPVNTILVKCNLANNEYMNPSDIIYSFTPNNVSFGSNIVVEAKSFAFINTKTGTISDIVITFVDQNLNAIQMQDKNLCIQLLIKSKDE